MGKRSVLALGIAGVLFGCGFLWQWLHQPDTYRRYLALQQAQGLPLEAHLGEAAARYTYTQNSSGQGSLCTELLLSEDQVLLGAIQYDSTAPEQFSPVLSTE